MTLTMVSFKILEIFVVNKLELGAIKITNLALEVGAHFQMYFESLEVIKSPGTKLAMRMIECYFTCSTRFSLFEMYLQLIVCVKFLFKNHAFSVLETNITTL